MCLLHRRVRRRSAKRRSASGGRRPRRRPRRDNRPTRRRGRGRDAVRAVVTRGGAGERPRPTRRCAAHCYSTLSLDRRRGGVGMTRGCVPRCCRVPLSLSTQAARKAEKRARKAREAAEKEASEGPGGIALRKLKARRGARLFFFCFEDRTRCPVDGRRAAAAGGSCKNCASLCSLARRSRRASPRPPPPRAGKMRASSSARCGGWRLRTRRLFGSRRGEEDARASSVAFRTRHGQGGGSMVDRPSRGILGLDCAARATLSPAAGGRAAAHGSRVECFRRALAEPGGGPVSSLIARLSSLVTRLSSLVARLSSLVSRLLSLVSWGGRSPRC